MATDLMAIYEYACDSCQEHFDIRRPMSEVETLVTCPYCKSVSTEKLWTPPNIGRASSTPIRESIRNTRGTTGIRMENAQDTCIENCGFENLDTGISMENSNAYGRGNIMKGNRRGMYLKNSIVDMPDLVIE